MEKLVGFLSLASFHVDRHSLMHYIFRLHINREVDLKEEGVVLPSSSFLRGLIFIKNPLQFNNQTAF